MKILPFLIFIAFAANASAQIDEELVGTWSRDHESMEFKADGNCIYEGHTFQYTAGKGQIKITTQQGTMVIPYSIRNDQLVINVDGQDFTYKKTPSR
jgi:hypothetical protein